MAARLARKCGVGGVVVALLCLAVSVDPTVAAAGDAPARVRLTNEQLERLADATVVPSPTSFGKHPKIATALLEVIEARRIRADWHAVAASRALMVQGDEVLVEVRTDAGSGREVAERIASLNGRIRNQVVPSLIEAWLTPDTVERAAEDRGVLRITPARRVRPAAGSVLSEGVAVLNVQTPSVSYDYHDLGADGTGVIIANIDAGYTDWASLQASGDWPQPAHLRRFEVDGGPPVDCDVSACPTYAGAVHGAATMEIVYDVAPGADYLTYAVNLISDWYEALLDATSRGAEVITVSLGAPLDGVGDGSECPPIWSAPCGTIAEASGIARSQGALVVNSASNSGTEHWGGDFADLGDGTHDWGGGGNLNVGTYCFYNGELVSVDLFWDDWTDVDHDYDLFLYEYRGTTSEWVERASSEAWQAGMPGQTPQEAIRYVVSGANGGLGCPPGSAAFAILVAEWNAATPRNLQTFADNWGSLVHITEDRSLGFPADSPNVYSVGAVDVASTASVEYYSSEGPVLGPGGSAAPPSPPNPKPDAVSVARVSTVTYGAGDFAGTSASAPHAAGVAALLVQLRNEKYATLPTTGNPQGIHELLSTFALEDPTFPAVFDTTYGNGLVKLRFCDQSAAVSNGEWTMLGLPCNRRDSASVAEVLGDDLDLTGVYWELWDWDAASASYRQLADTDQMSPGVGYWLLYEGDATIDIQGLVTDRSEAYPLAIVGEASPLGRPNFLGHVFSFDVPWPDATVSYAGAEHGLQDAFDDGVFRNYLWKPYTTTGYDQHDGLLGEGSLQSFDGFWVKAWQDAELMIPTSLAAEAAGRARTTGRFSSPVGWSIRLEAETSGVTARARLGQLPDSIAGWDAHDAELMPSFETHQFYVVLPHPEWGDLAGDYVRDFRPIRRTDGWRFEVRSNLGGKVTLRWDGAAAVLRQSFLVDLETGEVFSAAELEKGYEFTMAPGAKEFIWRVR